VRGWREIEANHFAACLLMPKKELMHELISLSREGSINENAIENLAKRFDVSVQAMSVRLAVLGVSL
jgi:Zn-dependent peptidase ImmA (M78 family)